MYNVTINQQFKSEKEQFCQFQKCFTFYAFNYRLVEREPFSAML